jgi:hypothetical protein
MHWRLIVVGGHTRSIGKTQLVCDLISVFPQAHWIAGKITQYGHGVCARNGKCCDCAPDEHICALSWERKPNNTDSGRFLAAGAEKSFWLRTKQGFLAEGMPLLRSALQEAVLSDKRESANVILESNTLLEFLKPSLYLMVLDSSKADFKDSARRQMEYAAGFILRRPAQGANGNPEANATWKDISTQLLQGKPRFLQREGDTLPLELRDLIQATLTHEPSIIV